MTSLLLLHDLKILISQGTLTHNMTNNKLAGELVVTLDLKKNIRISTTMYSLNTLGGLFLTP